MRMMIVEDNSDIRKELVYFFKESLFFVDESPTGKDALRFARDYGYDIILLDYLLPDIDGDSICKKIRLMGVNTPILIISGIDNFDSKVNLLNSGADDYIVKPFSFKELEARVKALIRRPKTIKSNIFEFGQFVFDFDKYVVKKENKQIILTRKEFSLIEYLIKNKERVVPRNELIENIWDMEADIFSNTLETHIFNIRKKFSVGKSFKIIQTFSGRGYKIGFD